MRSDTLSLARALCIHSLHLRSMGDKEWMNWPAWALAFYHISHCFKIWKWKMCGHTLHWQYYRPTGKLEFICSHFWLTGGCVESPNESYFHFPALKAGIVFRLDLFNGILCVRLVVCLLVRLLPGSPKTGPVDRAGLHRDPRALCTVSGGGKSS